MSEKILPTGDIVAMKIIEQERTESGLFIPEKARGNQRDCELGQVIAVGPGRVSEYGARQEVAEKVGDVVLISRGAGVQVETRDEHDRPMKVRLLRSVEIFAHVEESRILLFNQGLIKGGRS